MTNKSIFREIKDGDDVSDIVFKIFIILSIFVVFVATIVAIYTANQTPPNQAAVYQKELVQREADPTWRAEQKRLQKKYGNGRTIIYTPDEVYFYDDHGRKCQFI